MTNLWRFQTSECSDDSGSTIHSSAFALHSKLSCFLDLESRKGIPPNPCSYWRYFKDSNFQTFQTSEFTQVTVSLGNATQTFQRFIHFVLWNMDFCFCYLDNALVSFSTEFEHFEPIDPSSSPTLKEESTVRDQKINQWTLPDWLLHYLI